MSSKFGCSICRGPLKSDANSIFVTALCGHVYHDTCLNSWLTRSHQCPICKARTRTSDLKVIRLPTGDANEHFSILENVYNNGGPLKEQLDALKKKFSAHKVSVRPVVEDLEYIKDTVEDYIDFFKVISDRNKALERELEQEQRTLVTSLSEKKSKIHSTSLRVKQLKDEAQAEYESVVRTFNGLVREWQNNQFAQLSKVKARSELVVKMGDEPRRYIRDSYEKLAKRLSQPEI